LPRKNELVRPPIANVDIALIVVAVVPSVDFLLVDKLLIKFFSLGIEPVIVVNKMDLEPASQFLDDLRAQYGEFVKIVSTTAMSGKSGVSSLYPILAGKFSVLTGQSAVGKSSLLGVILSDDTIRVGELSAKTLRGKNTTRQSEIFVLDNGGLIADTPGFSAFELDNLSPEDIIDYTPELQKFSQKCKYNNCNHIGESIDICAVKRAVSENEFNKDRYLRFRDLYRRAKEKEDNKYE